MCALSMVCAMGPTCAEYELRDVANNSAGGAQVNQSHLTTMLSGRRAILSTSSMEI